MRSTVIIFIFAGMAVVAAVWGGCEKPVGGSDPAAWPLMTVRIDTLFTLGQDTASFFIFPENIVTDSKDRILIDDFGQNKVLVFSREGEYLYSIGRHGRGPAEFTEMEGLGIDPADVLTVFDRSSQLLKTFHSNGEFIKTIDLGESFDTGIDFLPWKDYTIMMYIRAQEYNAVTYPNYLHVYTTSYELVGDGVSQAEFDPSGNDIMRDFAWFFGSLIAIGDELFITPKIYSGHIYRYQLSEEGGKVHLDFKGSVQGVTYRSGIGEKLSFGAKEPVFWDYMQSVRSQSDYFWVYNQSAGLHRLSSGKVVHFTYLEKPDGKERVFGVELYDAAMQPLGYAPIRTNVRAKVPDLYGLRWFVKWKDGEDRFYITSKERGKSPLVHVVTLDFELD